MKYKVGDEVLVKVRIVEDSVFGYGLKTHNNILFTEKKNEVIPVPEMTAEEAWELARRIVGCREHGLEETKRREIFNRDDAFDVFNLFSVKEAKAKIEAWEASKEIKVGDFVELENEIFCVTSFVGEYCCGMDANGSVYSARKKDTKKTGRHIDIEGLLKQIGGTVEERNNNN